MAAHNVGNVQDVPEGSCKAVSVGERSLALFNVGGRFYATNDTCKHRGGSLGGGTLEGKIITCPLHGWTYDVTTGECEVNLEAKLETFPVYINGGEIFIEI